MLKIRAWKDEGDLDCKMLAALRQGQVLRGLDPPGRSPWRPTWEAPFGGPYKGKAALLRRAGADHRTP